MNNNWCIRITEENLQDLVKIYRENKPDTLIGENAKFNVESCLYVYHEKEIVPAYAGWKNNEKFSIGWAKKYFENTIEISSLSELKQLNKNE